MGLDDLGARPRVIEFAPNGAGHDDFSHDRVDEF